MRTGGVGGRIPALVITVNGDVQAQVLGQVVVVAVAKHVHIVACHKKVSARWRCGKMHVH